MRQLRWFELFPIVSYLILRGKCRTCGSYVPPRYFVVELLTAITFLMVYLQGGSLVYLSLVAVLAALLIVITVYDIYHYIIPNTLVILVSIIALALFGLSIYDGTKFSSIVPAILSAFGAFCFYGGLWKISAGHWIGFGDAKLVIPLAFLVGFPAVFSLVVLSFWVGAGVSVCIIGIQKLLKRGKIPLRIFGSALTIKSEIPFAPFLITGFILTYFFGVDVLSLVSYVL